MYGFPHDVISKGHQIYIPNIPNPNSQSSVVLGRSFSVTRNGPCVSVLLNTLDTTVSIQRGRKLGYDLPMRTEYEDTPNLERHQVKYCPPQANKDLVLKRINELKSLKKNFFNEIRNR